MHRSGTSLVAAMISALGMNLGERQLAADRNNRRGYFEDVDFLALNRRMLNASTPSDDGGHPDWGWTESERLDRKGFEPFRPEAQVLVAARALVGGVWGWKDPRTTLALDFWDSLLEGARYVFVYRHPWAVADSMQRLSAEVFLRHPEYAYRIWTFYNRHLLEFYQRHRERSLLLSTEALLREPERLNELLRKRLGLEVGAASLGGLIDPALFQSWEPEDPLIPLVAAAHPECAALLAELDAAADFSGAALWSAKSRTRAAAARPNARLSVVIPCFDQGEFLIEAVASVERSAPEPYELIVVNDGSREPHTLEVLEVLRRAGYQIVDQENGGLAAARNRGIDQALAPYVLPLDADNRLLPGFVGPALEVLDFRPQVGVVYGNRRDFGLRSEVVDVPPFDLDKILPFNFIDACVLLRKEVWSACGGFDPAMPAPGWEDWDLWIGAAERGWELHHFQGGAFEYRVRPSSMVSTFDDAELRKRMYAYVIAKHRDLYWRRLPEILVASQDSAAELFRLSREQERTNAEAADAFRAQRAELANREREVAALRVELASREDEIRTQGAEREALDSELAAWSERVAFMENTRAWRLRQWIVDLKRSFGPRSTIV
jgi:GT2 family glycosyltransferase